VEHDIAVKAVHGAVVGSHRGGVTAQNDDPQPKIGVTPVADRVTEGQPLTWRVTLSEAADVELWPFFVVDRPTTGPELSTKDVDPQWLMDNFGVSPDPEFPLSQVGGLYLTPVMPAGQTSAEVSVPTATDTVAEPAESLRFRLTDDMGEPQEGGPELTGTVLDAS
jgi:hypothetical protein